MALANTASLVRVTSVGNTSGKSSVPTLPVTAQISHGLGMTLEQFDAVGRWRPADELKPGDAQATTRDGVQIDGFVGLRDYIAGPRREDLLRALAHKLTGYALGRSVQLSDRKLVDELTQTMINGGRWSDVLLVIVRSEQFRCIRPAAIATTTSP